MKRLLIGLPLLFLAIGLAACSDNEDDPIVPTPVDITVTPSDRIVFEPDGGTQVLTVDAQGASWKVEKSDAWINVAPDTANNTIEVTVGPWDDLLSRSGSITVSGGGAEPVSIEVVQNGVEPQLTVDRTDLAFGSGKESQTITVTAVHVDWTIVAPEAEWIEVTADQAAGTILVSVQENPDTAPRSGSFVISGEGVDDITVTVAQEAAEAVFFLDRPIAYRMGYRGKVRSVSRHLDFVNGPTTDLVSFTDLQFDVKGNLTSFVCNYGSTAVAVEYDAADRITSIHAEGDELDVTLLFEYGSHGKYSPIFEIFESYLDPFYPIDFRCWMPWLIKDLAAIKVRDAAMPENNLAYRYTVSGDEGSIDTDYEIEGYDLEPVFTMNFAGAYPSILYYEGEESATYEIDPVTGLMGNYLYYSYYDILIERNADRLNTTSHSVLGSLERSFAYNENGDVTSRVVEGESEYNLTASYTYDAQGNWIVMDHTIGSASGTAERIITYWE